MYCTHCGKKINENKIEEKKSSYNIANESLTNKTEIQYECPRCGEIIHNHISKEEEKSLARAAHAEIQRGHNSFSRGMGNFCIGVIVLIISLIFWRLSYKAILCLYSFTCYCCCFNYFRNYFSSHGYI